MEVLPLSVPPFSLYSGHADSFGMAVLFRLNR